MRRLRLFAFNRDRRDGPVQEPRTVAAVPRHQRTAHVQPGPPSGPNRAREPAALRQGASAALGRAEPSVGRPAAPRRGSAACGWRPAAGSGAPCRGWPAAAAPRWEAERPRAGSSPGGGRGIPFSGDGRRSGDRGVVDAEPERSPVRLGQRCFGAREQRSGHVDRGWGKSQRAGRHRGRRRA